MPLTETSGESSARSALKALNGPVSQRHEECLDLGDLRRQIGQAYSSGVGGCLKKASGQERDPQPALEAADDRVKRAKFHASHLLDPHSGKKRVQAAAVGTAASLDENSAPCREVAGKRAARGRSDHQLFLECDAGQELRMLNRAADKRAVDFTVEYSTNEFVVRSNPQAKIDFRILPAVA